MAGLVWLWNQSAPSESSGASPGVALPFEEDRKNERHRLTTMEIAILFVGANGIRFVESDKATSAV